MRKFWISWTPISILGAGVLPTIAMFKICHFKSPEQEGMLIRIRMLMNTNLLSLLPGIRAALLKRQEWLEITGKMTRVRHQITREMGQPSEIIWRMSKIAILTILSMPKGTANTKIQFNSMEKIVAETWKSDSQDRTGKQELLLANRVTTTSKVSNMWIKVQETTATTKFSFSSKAGETRTGSPEEGDFKILPT